jgi:hypothetical protein
LPNEEKKLTGPTAPSETAQEKLQETGSYRLNYNLRRSEIPKPVAGNWAGFFLRPGKSG